MQQIATTFRRPKAASSWVQRHIRISSKLHPGIKGEDKVQFFQQLTTLFAAGTPLLEGLRIAAQQSQSKKMQVVIRTVADRVAAGQSLYQAVSDYPKVFNRQWIEVIKTGETSGRLAEVLATLTEFILAARETRKKIISALIYPCILIVVAVLAVSVMLWKVVPTFAEFFDEVGSKLPGITQATINLSTFLQDNGLLIVGGVVAFVFAMRFYLRSTGGKRIFDQLVLVVPMVGGCVVQSYMARFAMNAVLLLRSGLPLLETIGALRGVFHNNTVYRDALRTVERRVAGGEPLATALEDTRLFAPMLVAMVRVGEQSGELALVLEQASTFYRKKVEAMVERLVGIIEPLVILGMGITVAVILMAIYLPMFEMGSGPK